MKKMMRNTVLVLLMAALVAMMSGCFLLGGVTKTERVNLFVSALNKVDDISEHIHPDCGDYNASKNSSFITDGSPLDTGANGSASVSSVSETASGVSGKWSNDVLDDASFSMAMKEDGFGVWKIMSLTLDGDKLID